MANNNDAHLARESVKEARMNLQRTLRDRQIKCVHKTKNGPTLTKPENLRGFHQPIKRVIADRLFVCDECGEPINLTTVTKDQQDAAFERLYDMINQAKVLVGLTDSELGALESVTEELDKVRASLPTFYNRVVVDDIVEGNNRKKHNNNNNNNNMRKGEIGPNASSYNTR